MTQSEASSVDDWLINELFGKDGLVEPDGSGVMGMIRSAQDKKLIRVRAKINRLIVEAELRGFNVAFDCHDYDRLREYRQALSNNLSKGGI